MHSDLTRVSAAPQRYVRREKRLLGWWEPDLSKQRRLLLAQGQEASKIALASLPPWNGRDTLEYAIVGYRIKREATAKWYMCDRGNVRIFDQRGSRSQRVEQVHERRCNLNRRDHDDGRHQGEHGDPGPSGPTG